MREIVIADFDKYSNTKGYGRRMALVLTRERMRPLLHGVTLAPITTRVTGGGFEVPVPASYGIDEDSVANMDNVTTVNPDAVIRTVAWFPSEAEPRVLAALQFVFDLRPRTSDTPTD